jgi:hypothetical protein
MSVKKAEHFFKKAFKPNPNLDEIQTNKIWKAELHAIDEILKEMADEEGKVKKFKGGRFEQILVNSSFNLIG